MKASRRSFAASRGGSLAAMAIEEINAKGGVLGKKLEPVLVDPASNWPLFAEKARKLIKPKRFVLPGTDYVYPRTTN